MEARDEQHLVDESQEISLGESPEWLQQTLKAFPAFRHKNYRLYFSGQLVSLVGTWLQTVAQGWLVLQLTNSPFWLGVVSALSMLPVLLFSLFAGVIIDSFSKRKILILSESTMMVLAFILGVTTILQLTTIWEICIISFLFGVITAIDNPARQAFAVEMVGKEDLHSAIALNSATFNGARVIGPAIAGILIAIVGTGGAFVLNGLSFLAVILALYLMRVKEFPSKAYHDPIKAIKEGLKFSFTHPIIRILLMLATVNAIFGWSYTTILPAIAKNTFNLDAAGLGYMYVAVGIGALIAAAIVSIFGKIGDIYFILGGNLTFSLALFAFSFTNNLWLAYILLGLLGFSLIAQFSTINTIIQKQVSDALRGRVMSIYTLFFLGMMPIGSFEVGFLAEHFSSGLALRIGAIVVFLSGTYVFTQRKKIRQSFRDYTHPA